MKIPSIVNVQWLAQAILKTKPLKPLRIVDGTWRLKDGSIEAQQDFLDEHIPGAVFFDIDECCDKTNDYPHMIPNEKLFAEYVKHLAYYSGTMKLPSLISINWLAQTILKTKPWKSLSVVYTAVGAKRDFIDNHIPGAVYFNIDECCDMTSVYPHMLPNEKRFAEYVQHLGITNESHIIAYDNDEDFGVFSSPRVWWMFRCFGHEAISVLNGGFHKWLAAGLPVESGETKPIKTNQPFNAKFNPSLVRDYEAMVANVKSGGTHAVVDARSKARFLGAGSEPRPGMLVGRIPFSGNVPFVELLDENRQLMKDSEQLKEIFSKHNVDLNRPMTTTCGSAITACVVALAAHESGAKDVSVYDGSWAEWGRRATPDLVERN